MRKSVKIAAIVAIVVTLAVATIGVAAFAQESGNGSSAISDLGQKLKEAIASALGISVEKYDETVTTAGKQVLDEAVAAGEITQEQADRMLERLNETGDLDVRGMGHGAGGTSVLLTVAADKLGLTVDALRTELRTKSIADVAKEKGVDTQVISDAYLAQIKADLDAKVAAGTLTQAQADTQLKAKTDALADRLAATGSPLGGPGRGGRGGHGGQPDSAPAATGEDNL